MEEQTVLNFRKYIATEIGVQKIKWKWLWVYFCPMASLTLKRIGVETESENPTPAYFCTFSSKHKHSTAFIYMALFSFYLCIFRIFNKIFAQKVFRTCEGPRCQFTQRTVCKRGAGSWMGEKWLGREAQREEKKAEWPLT